MTSLTANEWPQSSTISFLDRSVENYLLYCFDTSVHRTDLDRTFDEINSNFDYLKNIENWGDKYVVFEKKSDILTSKMAKNPVKNVILF